MRPNFPQAITKEAETDYNIMIMSMTIYQILFNIKHRHNVILQINKHALEPTDGREWHTMFA